MIDAFLWICDRVALIRTPSWWANTSRRGARHPRVRSNTRGVRSVRENRRRSRRLPDCIAQWLDMLDRIAFRDPDLRAMARGWEVRRPRLFQRVYRDPRWNRVTACTLCAGRGTVDGYRCPKCNGRGRIIAAPPSRVTQR